jgi:hypothetical protein
MKKVYLAASALFVAGIAGAQLQTTSALHKVTPMTKEVVSLQGESSSQDRAPGDPIVSDNLDTPANWSMPTDADGHAWQHVSTTPSDMTPYWGSMASTTASNGFAVFNGIEHLLAGVVDPQNVILAYTPQINCTGIPAVTLEFEQRYRAFNSDKVYVEVSGNNGGAWTQYEINTALAGNGPTIQELYTMDISAVAGGQAQVLIRFRWEELSGDNLYGSGYGWGIDDFMVYESWLYDQANTASYARIGGTGIAYPPGLDYFMIPDEHLSAITFSGVTTNMGAVTQTGATFNVTVDKGAQVFSGTSAPVDLAFGASDSLVATATYTPGAGMGQYDVTMWFDGTNAEEITNNDTVYTWFEVTDYTYGRDDDFQIGGISNVTSSPEGVLTIGNVMEMFATDEIGAIDIFINDVATSEGQLMYAHVYWFDGTDYILVGQSDDYTIQPGDLDNWVKLILDAPVSVSAGDDILILAGHYGGPDPVEFGTAQIVDEGTVLGYVDGSLFQLTEPQVIMVRADMRDFTGIEEINTSFSIGQNVPNPFENTSVITYSLNEAANVTVSFTDVTGKVVKTVAPGTQSAGTYTITVDANELAEGVYFYTFTIGDQKVTKQMVVTK